MSNSYNAFEISPVPVPALDAVAPEPFHGIYGMPMFVTVPTTDLAASERLWCEGLGFFNLFAVPDQLIHMRRWAFQDVLLVSTDAIDATTPSMTTSFACVVNEIDAVAAACEAVSPGSVQSRKHTPWNTLDLEVITPENLRVVYTAAKPFDPASQEAQNLADMGVTPPADRTAREGERLMSTAQPRGLTVGEVAAHLGVTVRTLHHWETSGVAVPTDRSPSGYRLYSDRDLARLQRVLTYRELDMPLPRIKEILDADNAESVTALREQQDAVTARIQKLTDASVALERMIAAREKGILLTVDQQAAIFGPDWKPEWLEQARDTWGDTPEWGEYLEKSSGRSRREWDAVARSTTEADEALATAKRQGVTPGSEAANELAEAHRAAFSRYFHIS